MKIHEIFQNISRDWCVSRQLWWGHKIPAYRYKVNNFTKWIVAASEKEAINQIKQDYGYDIPVHQDPDVLDTWFSSSLLPFSAMGWLTNVSIIFQNYNFL